ncbi:MAG: bifunctional (p)ppGpp synthetase/guanosine-3',5'-bis(diphosphate) 3'-pyrophosphohydrolase [Eubacteriales bacterium]|nr:bifunctional (p)ppGpp synthetase/guanosine-3',5'-bis(diphosphate) 3'-pyrophosphohydrolase [Eubacteriales bacterium]
MTTEQFIEDLKTINEKYDDPMVVKAFDIANNLHNGQMRKSGEPYIIHPIAVAKILASFGMDTETVVAGLLHDVVEDTEYTREQLVEDFNEEIALLVDGVTKLGNIKYDSKEELQAENFRKMFLAMSKDIRVLIIKLADRLHNMRTMEFMPPHKRKEKSAETLEIYAPLAGRLGIYSIKFELEDLAFKYLHPSDYESLSVQVNKRKEEREKIVDQLIDEISDELDKSNFHYDVMGRSKHLYSIYKKMTIQHKQLDEIFDLIAIRVIVNSVKDCYAVLGLVHTRWTPIPGRFKDYIAMPKPNMYQSLHTTVLDDNGDPFEIQIRTYEMHRIAEYGIAAHWKYKEGKGGQSNGTSEQKLAWLRQALEWQKETDDSMEFLETLKMDLFDNQVFVFTPKGDVIELPAESTPLDFAFKIHTDVGIRCVGAKVNGKMVTIDHKLKTGDIIDIITSANSAGPSMDWLNIAKSSQAKNKIRNWLRKANKNDSLDRGKSNIANYIKKKGYDPHLVAKNAYLLKAVKDLKLNNVNELYLQIANGGSALAKLGQRLIDYYKEDNRKEEIRKEEEIKNKKTQVHRVTDSDGPGIIVKGSDNLLIRIARCCTPVPGDDIIGFITKGRGITVHRRDCSNIVNLPERERGRLIDVEWETPKVGQTYYADINISGIDRKGLFSDISKVCEDMDVRLVGVNMKPVDDEYVNVTITVAITGTHQIQRLLISLRNVSGIDKVYRAKS